MFYWLSTTSDTLQGKIKPFLKPIASLTKPTLSPSSRIFGYSEYVKISKTTYVEKLLIFNKDQMYEIKWLAEFISALWDYSSVKQIGANVNEYRNIKKAIYDLKTAKGEDALDAIVREHNQPNIQTSTITWVAKAIVYWNNDNDYPFRRSNIDFQEYYHISEHIATGSFKPIFNLIDAEITRLEQIDSGGDII